MGGGAPQALEVRRDGSVVRLGGGGGGGGAGGGAGGGGESGRRGSLGAALALRGGWRRRLLPRPAFGSVGLLCSAAVSSAAGCDML